MSRLVIEDLYVSVEGKQILKGINLSIGDKEIHALLGPNGNGKSTLLQTIMGHPKYVVDSGKILLDDEDVLTMSVDQRSRAGLFLGMQYPVEISGVTNSDFLRAAINARSERQLPLFQFIRQLEKSLKDLQLKSELAHRFLNEGFSGGEKKRNEIVQMSLLKPKVAMLDEIDSGLDVDALRIVADAIAKQAETTQMGLLIVSHYERFYQLLQPTFVHVIIDGQIVCSGDMELVTKIDQDGYDWLLQEMNLKLPDRTKKLVYSLGVCGVEDKGPRAC